MTLCSLSDPAGAFGLVARAVAAAARITRPDGTICVASRSAARPGPVFTRWRQGIPLRPLVREALESGDPVLVEDAARTRSFAAALGERRLILLSTIDAEVVEDLGFGHAGSPAAVARLASRADTVSVLHEADRMFPGVR